MPEQMVLEEPDHGRQNNMIVPPSEKLTRARSLQYIWDSKLKAAINSSNNYTHKDAHRYFAIAENEGKRGTKRGWRTAIRRLKVFKKICFERGETVSCGYADHMIGVHYYNLKEYDLAEAHHSHHLSSLSSDSSQRCAAFFNLGLIAWRRIHEMGEWDDGSDLHLLLSSLEVAKTHHVSCWQYRWFEKRVWSFFS